MNKFKIPLEKRFPFAKELLGPYHTEFLRDRAARPLKDEIAIDGSWKIVMPRRAPEQLELAAKDLQEFFRVSMGMKLAISRASGNPGRTISIGIDKRAVLKKDHDAGEECFIFKAGDGGIEIIGIDASGAMYGVYRLENLIRFRQAPFVKKTEFLRKPVFQTRIFRSVLSPYYHDELYDGSEYYTDNILKRISHHGFNGIWIHGILRDIAPCRVFPELGKGSGRRIAKLKRIIKKGARYGIKVYLYFTEPLNFQKDHPFWKRHPEVKGAPGMSDVTYEVNSFALCTSTRPVKRFLREGMYELFSRAKGLGGVILITASEHQSHCYSHADIRNALNEVFKAKEVLCSRCARRSPQDVVSEVVDLIRRGARRANPKAKVIAWNWSWSMYEKEPQRKMIEAMPEGVAIMGGFERGAKIVVEGMKKINDEYSLCYVGPSERFQGLARAARSAGREVFAKIQLSTAQDCLIVPYFPVMQKICRKFENLKKWRVAGLMATWNFGNFPTISTEIASEMSWQDGSEPSDTILLKYAGALYGKENARDVVRAWAHFSKATDFYPLDMKFFYWGPLNRGSVIYPFTLEKLDRQMARAWLFDDPFGDRMSDWTCVLGVSRTIRALERTANRWKRGVGILENLLDKVPPEKKNGARKDWAVAKAFLLLARSTANFARFHDLRDRRLQIKAPKKRKEMYKKMKNVCLNEMKLVDEFYPLIKVDNRIGFHAEAQGYFITRKALDEKKENLREIIKRISRDL